MVITVNSGINRKSGEISSVILKKFFFILLNSDEKPSLNAFGIDTTYKDALESTNGSDAININIVAKKSMHKGMRINMFILPT